jgi:SAM-dependent methyltransferase
MASAGFEGPTRFIRESAGRFEEFKQSAKAYADQLTPDQSLGFWQKPLDHNPGHPSFFAAMYQLFNGIQAMNLAPGSTIIEVGAGAGWATEWLAGLNYRVICVEPSAAMVDVAKQRVRNFLDVRKLSPLYANVSWICTTIEEANLDDEIADAVLFFESFHHVIDEHRTLASTHRILRSGGAICILGDSNWIPGNRDQEGFWGEEMDTFGTLESPFTHAYLEHVLRHHGFSQITRNHALNLLIPVDRDQEPVRNFVGLDASFYNLFTAKKSGVSLKPKTVSLDYAVPKRSGIEQICEFIPESVRPAVRGSWHKLRPVVSRLLRWS